MDEPNDDPTADELRRHAEERLALKASPPAGEADAQRLLHELQVHQIELEMQNEELRQSRAVAEAALRQISGLNEDLNLLAKVFTNSGEGILIADDRNRVVTTNDAFTQLTGYSAAEALGQDPLFLSVGESPAALFARIRAALDQRGHWEGELRFRRQPGMTFPIRLTITVVRDRDERTTHYLFYFSDISERLAAESRMLQLAHHDELTGLPNRHSLHQRLGQAIKLAKRGGTQLALLMIDLDRFKAINDAFGHQIGDRLLTVAASRLTQLVRETDIVARLGGDEFVVVVTGIVTPGDAAEVAEKIVRALAIPYQIEGHDLRTSPSIGICLYPDDAPDNDDLLRNADVAMYHAKSLGGRNFQFFTESLNRMVQARRRLETDLRTALEQRQFVLHYQPLLDVRLGRLAGMEALLRWQHPDRGLVSPMDFIPIAEETGLIFPLGEWVIKEACRQLKAWKLAGLPPVRMSINLSAGQFQDGNLPGLLCEALAEAGLDADSLDLNVAESVAMATPDKTIAILRTLAEQGLHLSIDNFGTGYSSLARLKAFPVHSLKIDRSFVQDIDADGANICELSAALAHRLGLEVVGEGVETQAQMDYLRRIGCEQVQGFAISEALPAEQATRFIESYPATSAAD